MRLQHWRNWRNQCHTYVNTRGACRAQNVLSGRRLDESWDNVRRRRDGCEFADRHPNNRVVRRGRKRRLVRLPLRHHRIRHHLGRSNSADDPNWGTASNRGDRGNAIHRTAEPPAIPIARRHGSGSPSYRPESSCERDAFHSLSDSGRCGASASPSRRTARRDDLSDHRECSTTVTQSSLRLSPKYKPRRGWRRRRATETRIA